MAASDGPLVVLLGENGTHRANGRRAVGDDADDIGRRWISLSGRSSELFDADTDAILATDRS